LLVRPKYYIYYRHHIKLHDPNEVPIFGTSSHSILSRQTNIVVYQPQLVKSDSNLKQIDINDRNCRMSEELMPNQLGKVYNQNNCNYQWQLKKMLKHWNCLPWNFNYVQNDPQVPATFCYSHEEKIFLQELNEERDLAFLIEDCLEACDHAHYSSHPMLENYDITRECAKLISAYAHINRSLPFETPHWLMATLTTDLRMSTRRYSYLTLDYPCEYLMASTTIIKIRPGVNRIGVLHQHKRVTFLSQLAAFGNAQPINESLASNFRWNNWALHGH